MDLEIDFRKFECEEVNSSNTLTCTSKENDNEKRSPHEEKLAYELKQEAFRLAGLGWAGSGLGWPDLAWVDASWPGLAAPE